MTENHVRGRVALVTGSSGAVGSAVASHLQSLGAIVARSHSGRTERSGEDVADLSSESDVIRLFDAVENRLGHIQIVVHTAGGFASGGRLEETTLDVWRRMHIINVQTSFLCLRESLRRMRGTAYGRVILFGAASALHPQAGRGAYDVGKASVHHLVSIAAQEVHGTGVTVNAIAPLIIDTPANRAWSSPDPTWTSVGEICRTIEAWCDPLSAENGLILRLPPLP